MKHSIVPKLTFLLIALCLAFAVIFNAPVRSKAQGAQAVPHIDQAEYLGSAKCAACHKSHYES